MSTQEFWITKMFAADEHRHAAIPKTVATIRFWAMISPLLMPWSCPLRIMCITSKLLRVLQAVRKEPNPKQYLARLLTNRWSCSMMLLRYATGRNVQDGESAPSCCKASNAGG